MGNAQAIEAARQAVSLHLSTLNGETCVACGQAFPCTYRRAADGALNTYGCLPKRVPGATLRAAGVNQAAVSIASWPVNRRDQNWTNANHYLRRNEPRRRGWFNAAVGVATVPK